MANCENCGQFKEFPERFTGKNFGVCQKTQVLVLLSDYCEDWIDAAVSEQSQRARPEPIAEYRRSDVAAT